MSRSGLDALVILGFQKKQILCTAKMGSCS